MGKRTVVHITDDIDGSEDAETVTFAYDGRSYEIDLSEENKKALESALERFISAGRKVSTASRPAARGSRSRGSSNLAEIREWARSNGHSVSARGRISQDIMDAYNAAH